MWKPVGNVLLFLSHTHSRLSHFQTTLLCNPEHDGLEAADLVILGTVRVWGSSMDNITNATMVAGDSSVVHQLTVQHIPDTKVRGRICVCVRACKRV